MPDLLGATNPVPSYEAPPVRVTVPAPTDTSVQNIVDTERATRADRRDQQDTRDSTTSARYESNFMTFFQRLRDARQLPDAVMRILQWGGAEVSSGIRAGFAQELSELMRFLQMDENALLEFLKNQMESGSRFSGALFQLLRDAYGGSGSELSQADILQFLKRYSDFSSTEHLEGKILRSVEDMTESLPSPWSGQVADILAKLQNGAAAGDRQGNLDILQGELFPLVARYVSQTHDHGRARGLLAMLTLDVARYANGDEAALAASFRHLAASGSLPENLGKLSDEEILRLLKNTAFTRAAENNRFADQLAQLTDHALQGQGGASAQEAFHNILSALLLNESVYMPLNHAMVPMDWHGKKAFSELWLDPDADGTGGAAGGRAARLLIKLDIQDLGAFDLLFNTRGTRVALQVGCPTAVAEHAQGVAETMATILARNGLQVETVRVQEMQRPITVSEAFPKVFRQMGGVNVRV